MNPLQKQEGGSHYKDCKIQPVEYIHANGLGYIEGAVIKYVTRYKAKNGAEDIKKAIHFLELLLQLEYPATAAAHKAPSLCDSEDARDTAAAYPYTFPAALKYMGMLSSDYVVKLREEVGEVSDATNPTDRVIELLDVIHVAETGIRSHALDHGLDVKELVSEVIRKNSARGYYQR